MMSRACVTSPAWLPFPAPPFIINHKKDQPQRKKHFVQWLQRITQGLKILKNKGL